MPGYLRLLVSLTAVAMGALLIQFWLYDPPHAPPCSAVLGVCLLAAAWKAVAWPARWRS